jgi:FkbM family methyltransferase
MDRASATLLGRVWHPGKDRERTVKMRDGTTLAYRLNRGDIQSISEVWLYEAYRLPSSEKRKVLVDLGANIGLTSLWLTQKYGFQQVISVEPVPSNARLVRQNLESNGIQAEIIEAAVGPDDGTVYFEENAESNQGHVSKIGRAVRMISMISVMEKLSTGEMVDLLKIDIEGGEQALLTGGDLSWLGRIREIIIEFHPNLVDYKSLISILENAGFKYFPASAIFPDSMDYFKRRDRTTLN